MSAGESGGISLLKQAEKNSDWPSQNWTQQWYLDSGVLEWMISALAVSLINNITACTPERKLKLEVGTYMQTT